jgi:hypothetical protein
MRFPGDLCDPFIDTCVDAGNDYECSLDYQMVGSEYETVFKCNVLNNSNPGDYGDLCVWGHEGCKTGSYCTSAELAWPNEQCGGGFQSCCATLCKFNEMCPNGPCHVTDWQADLGDYLDQYTGIGYCPGA